MGRKSKLKREQAGARAEVLPQSTPAPLTTTESAGWRHIAIAAAAIVVLLVIVYGQVRTHEFINFDDPLYVTENNHVREGLSGSNVRWAFTSFEASNWHPLTWLSLMTDAEIFGIHAGSFVLMNVAMHVIASMLLLFFLWRATGSAWKSAAVTALFAIHPLRVESVAWVAERKDVLSTMFFFATLVAWGEWSRRRSRLGYWLALLFFILGLLAKPMLVTLPFVLLLVDVWPLRRIDPATNGFGITRGVLLDKIPFFALLIPSVLLTLRAQSGAIAATLSPAARFGNATLSYLGYIAKLFWPSHLAVFYPINPHPSALAASAAFVVIAALTAAVIRFGRTRPYLPVGWFWYLGTLVPVIGILQVGRQAMADRYSYIPSVGILLIVVWGVGELVARRREARLPAAAVVMISVIAFAAVSSRQLALWKDSETLFTHTLSVTTDNYVAHTNLGAAFVEQMRFPEAESEFRKALALSPQEVPALIGLGHSLRMRGDLDDAATQFRRALELDPKNASAYRSLADLELARGRNAEAAALLRKAVAIRSDAETQAVLAAAEGKNDEAISHYREAIEANPRSALLHNDFAALLARTGHDDEAMAEYQKSIEIAPDFYDARMNYAAILSRHNRDADAISNLKRATELHPNSAEPHVYMGLIYSMGGQAKEAASEIEAAIKIDHDVSNQQFTNALKIPPGPKNIDEYLQFLRQQETGAQRPK